MLAELSFDFDETKATQVVGVALSETGGLFDYYLLQKCLYAIDREALTQWGRPIIGGDLKMLKWGPVNQTAMDAFKERRPGFFSDCFDRNGNEVVKRKDPGTSELSQAEIRLIQAVVAQWRHLDFQQAHDKAVSFPECKPIAGQINWIAPEQVLRAAGKSQAQIDRLRQEWAEHRLLTHKPTR